MNATRPNAYIRLMQWLRLHGSMLAASEVDQLRHAADDLVLAHSDAEPAVLAAYLDAGDVLADIEAGGDLPSHLADQLMSAIRSVRTQRSVASHAGRGVNHGRNRMSSPNTSTDLAEITEHLRLLYVVRALAAIEGLDHDWFYMAAPTSTTRSAPHRSAYTGAAVTEIASLRAALSGPLLG